MDILLWVVVWMLVGCGIAWMIGAAASLSDAPVGQPSSHHDAIGNIHHFPLAERAQPDVGAELSAAAGTDQGRLRSL
jgi:hypothetical protein